LTPTKFEAMFGKIDEVGKKTAGSMPLRIPKTLKASIDAAAEDAEQSANAWAMRCLERCANMDEIGEKLGEIWQTARSATANDADAFSKETLLEMLSHIDDVGGKDCCSSWLGRKGARKSAHRCWLPCGYGRARP
jgi:hypothetical protein